MSWTDSVLSVWQLGKSGILQQYDSHLRPSCPTCQSSQSTQSPSPSLPSPSTMAPSTSPIVRLAGLSGALAIGLGAYGAHKLAGQDIPQERLKAFEVANRYHLVHSVALLGLPLASRPRLAGLLMVSGMSLFCGTTYYHALTGDKQ